jgi:hypothetical protein
VPMPDRPIKTAAGANEGTTPIAPTPTPSHAQRTTSNHPKRFGGGTNPAPSAPAVAPTPQAPIKRPKPAAPAANRPWARVGSPTPIDALSAQVLAGRARRIDSVGEGAQEPGQPAGA